VQKAGIRWWVLLLLICVAGLRPALAQNGLQKVNHIIIVMQENHSFDNYFGGSPLRSRQPLSLTQQIAWRLCAGRPCLRRWFIVSRGRIGRPALLQLQP
jgi:phospholipase C